MKNPGFQRERAHLSEIALAGKLFSLEKTKELEIFLVQPDGLDEDLPARMNSIAGLRKIPGISFR
jgi:hypothetical protein